MDNQKEPKPLINKILDKAKSGQIKMKPGSYFILKTILAIVGIFIIGASVLFLISLIHFNLKASGILYLPKFGFFGFSSFIKLMPWLLISVSVILIIFLEVLAKRFSFVYRKPIVYSLIIIILFVFIGGIIIDRTPLHPKLFLNSQERQTVAFDPFYKNIHMMEERGIYRGFIFELTESGFFLKAPRKTIINVIFNQKTRFPSGSDFVKDDAVVVTGKRIDNNLNASGILKIYDNLESSPFFWPDRPMRALVPKR